MKPDKKNKSKSIKLTIPMKPKTKTSSSSHAPPKTPSPPTASEATPPQAPPPPTQPPLPAAPPPVDTHEAPNNAYTTATNSNSNQHLPAPVQDDPPPKLANQQQPKNIRNQTSDNGHTVNLQIAVFDEVRQSLARANINDNTLRQYCKAYNEFVTTIKWLPNPETGKADDAIEKYVMEQHNSNPRPGCLRKVTQALCMLKIMHPKVYTKIPVTRLTLSNWKKFHVPKSATEINTVMARGFASFLNRIGEHYAAAALIVQQAACLRPCEVLAIKKGHVRLPGSIALRGAGPRVAALVISNGKTAKNGKPQLAIVSDETAIQVLEILMETTKHLEHNTGLFANITYAAYSRHLHIAANYFGFSKVNVTHMGHA